MKHSAFDSQTFKLYQQFGLFFIFLFISNTLVAQQAESNSGILETTHDTSKLSIYLDTISKYIYINNQIVEEYFDKCEQLKINPSEISDNLRWKHTSLMIYDELGKENNLEAFQIIKESRPLIDEGNISLSRKNEFKYLEAYTQMVLGDFEFAQKNYYEIVDYALQHKDTSALIQSYYSLGQLFAIQKDFKNAEKYFLKEFELEAAMNLDEAHKIQIILELVKLYNDSKQYDKAKKYATLGLESVNKYDIKDLKVDLLILRGEIALADKDIKKAQEVHAEAAALAHQMGMNSLFNDCQTLKAKIYSAKGKHAKALTIFERLVVEENLLQEKKELCEHAHKEASKMGDHNKAYAYALQANSIQDSINHEKKMQQTQYLTARFDAAQKEKTNQILEATILQKQTQNKYLYALASIFLLFLTLLFGAFYQKRKYSNRLECEVKKRTQELETANTLLQQSNNELDEFTRIFSHDLKEPLRSIVGFSTLASRKLEPDSDASEYLNIISKSGKQLNQLIEDVSVFQKVGKHAETPISPVNTNQVVGSIIDSIQMLLDNKNVQIQYQDLPEVLAHRSFLFLVFKNLIENGIKYNQSQQPCIQIRHHESEGLHYFDIEDNGIGIDAKYHSQVFDMFKRLNDRSTYEGTGLGLSMARKMMQKMNGDICVVKSEKDKGSTFQVRLPITIEAAKHWKMDQVESN